MKWRRTWKQNKTTPISHWDWGNWRRWPISPLNATNRSKYFLNCKFNCFWIKKQQKNKFVLILQVRLQFRAVWNQRSRLRLVERPERNGHVFLGRTQLECPHVPMRNRSQLRRLFGELQLRFVGTRRLSRWRYELNLISLEKKPQTIWNWLENGLVSDAGVITDKNLLPVTRLNFGRTQLSSSSGIHTLGRFICSGQFVFAGTPTTCADLSLIGHTLTGFYSVKGKTTPQAETIYCNFNKLPSDSGSQRHWIQLNWLEAWFHLKMDLGYETKIGFSALKSSPIYFTVKRNESTTGNSLGIVTFQVEQLNIGGAMNLTSGVFTAPRNTTYFFAFNGVAGFTSSTTCSLEIELLTKSGQFLAKSLLTGSLDNGQLLLECFSRSDCSSDNRRTSRKGKTKVVSLFVKSYLEDLFHSNIYNISTILTLLRINNQFYK